MDYDTWKATDPDADNTTCSDCGETCDHTFHAPDFTPGYHPGKKGPVVCEHCHELYNPAL